MFGLFRDNKKQYQPTVTVEDKKWIETNIGWFIEVFGLERLKKQPFILPTFENFPYDNVKDDIQFQKMFEQICQYWEVNPKEIIVSFFDDIKSMQWTNRIPQGEITQASGIYNQIYTTEEQRFKIQLAKSNLDIPELLVSVLSHEIAHVKLLGGGYISSQDRDMELLTDLATIYFGFGIFVANSVQPKDINWIGRVGYLPNEVISYTNALLCYITQHEPDQYLKHFNNNTKELFKKDFEFLFETDDTILTKDKVSENEAFYRINVRIEEGFNQRNFEEVIVACEELIDMDPKNSGLYNSLGYAILLQKKYEEAIAQFDKAVMINPYWDNPYNNRGYCKLQLGDLENALVDIESAYQMNPDNSFCWRNMGAYYLQVNEYEKALEYFTEAEKIDPKTELINFYLGHTYLKMGDSDKAKTYFDKSTKLEEYNDSVLIVDKI